MSKNRIRNKEVYWAILFLALATTVYSWGSVWHDVSLWIQNGKVIAAKDLAENLQYIYDRISNDNECGKGALLRYNQSLNKFECFKCPIGAAVKWINGKASCEL